MHRVFRAILGTACSERPRTEAGLESASDAVVVRPHATPCILAEDSTANVAPVASQAPVILALRCGFMVVALSPAQRMRCSWQAFWHVYCSEGHEENDRMPGVGCLLLLHYR